MTAAEFIKILVPITLIEMMVAIGLGVSFAELAALMKLPDLVCFAITEAGFCPTTGRTRIGIQ